MTPDPQPLPFHLSGPFAPVREERTAVDLPVTGAIPPELRGLYVRNGPNPRGASPAWFAGEGMLHGVRLEGGVARWYRNRWIGGPYAPNTHIVRHAGHLLALVEVRAPIEVDAALNTLGPYTFGGALPGSMTAHPRICPRTGELLFFSYGTEAPFLTYYRADAAGRIVHQAPLTVPVPTYLHDFAITAHHAVFYDLPVEVTDWRSPEPFRWLDDHRPRLGVLPRDGTDADMRWFDVRPGAISHTLNAWEEGDLVVLDTVRAPRLGMPYVLYRYVLDLRTGAVEESVLHPSFLEFPRVHPAWEGAAARLGYAVELADWGPGGPGRVVPHQIDLRTGQSQAHPFAAGRLPGELVVAPRPGGQDEDDAWLLTLVHNPGDQGSDLVILDARDFGSPPVATVHLPGRVPFGLHGAWMPD